jgi:hypothetical protein
MENNQEKSNYKQSGGKRVSRKNIYKVVKNKKMNGGGFLDTFLGGDPPTTPTPGTIVDATPPPPPTTPTPGTIVDNTPTLDATPTPDATPIPDATPTPDPTPTPDNKEESKGFLSQVGDSITNIGATVKDSAQQIFNAEEETKVDDAEEEGEEGEEEEDTNETLDIDELKLENNTIKTIMMNKVSELMTEVIKLQQMLIPSQVSTIMKEDEEEFPSDAGPMRMSELNTSPAEESQTDAGPMRVSELNASPEVGDEQEVGDDLGTDSLEQEGADELGADELGADDSDKKDVAEQPGGKKKAKKNVTRRRKLFGNK